MDSALSCSRGPYEASRERTMRYLLSHLERHLCSHEHKRFEHKNCAKRLYASLAKRCLCVASTLQGNYLTCTYLGVKLLYVINAVAQLFLLNLFLGTDYHMYGIHVITSLLEGNNAWAKSSQIFPRVTMCDFIVRRLATQHKHTVQCVLPINLFNEKIYLFLWFWFVFLAIVSFFSLTQWIRRIGGYTARVLYIRKQERDLGQFCFSSPFFTTITKKIIISMRLFFYIITKKNSFSVN